MCSHLIWLTYFYNISITNKYLNLKKKRRCLRNELGHVPEPDGASPLNNGTDSLKDGRTSFQRQKTGARDGENGFLDMKETTLNERESEQCDEMSSKYYNNKYVVVRAYDNQNMSR